MTAPIALRSNCVGFTHGDEFTVIIWPSGTRWIDATSKVELKDGTTVGLGDDVQLGGGFQQISFLVLGSVSNRWGQDRVQRSPMRRDRASGQRLVRRPINRVRERTDGRDHTGAWSAEPLGALHRRSRLRRERQAGIQRYPAK
jgi:hypothetical protein